MTKQNNELDKILRNKLEHKMASTSGECELSDNCVNKLKQQILDWHKREMERVIGEDERIDIQSDFDKLDVPHLEADKYPGLDGVRQASRNLLRARQRELMEEE